MKKLPDLYRGEAYKVKLLLQKYDSDNGKWGKITDEGIVGTNRFDLNGIVEAWLELHYGPGGDNFGGKPITNPYEISSLVLDVIGDVTLSDFNHSHVKIEPNKWMEILIRRSPASKDHHRLFAKVISITFGQNISNSDGEALANL